jgi:hypothetical protein
LNGKIISHPQTESITEERIRDEGAATSAERLNKIAKDSNVEHNQFITSHKANVSSLTSVEQVFQIIFQHKRPTL